MQPCCILQQALKIGAALAPVVYARNPYLQEVPALLFITFFMTFSESLVVLSAILSAMYKTACSCAR